MMKLCRSGASLSCTALFDVPISVLLFGCRSTPIIRIMAGRQGGWPLEEVYMDIVAHLMRLER